MTAKRFVYRFRGGLSIAVTVLVLGSALLVQHLRHGWPFSLHHGLGLSGTSMEAMPKAKAEGHPAARVPVDVEVSTMAQLGIRIEAVRHEAMTEPVRAIATIALDESRISHVHTRVAGWIEELTVNTTGQTVRKGEPLARIFSQELLASQTEYLVARQNAIQGPASMVVESGRARLKVLGMTETEIQAIEHSGEPLRLVTVVAPRSGVVLHRGMSAGTAVDPSTELLTVADLSTVWILAEVPEADMKGITLGTPATLDFPALQERLSARVTFIYPTLTERTRTLRVRLEVPNPKRLLRPGLYGSAEFQITARHVLTVSRDAVVDTGLAQHVFVATTSGRFEPRQVTLGSRLEDRVEVRSGLKEGEPVVASGVFLLDSESRLRASGGAAGHDHGSMQAQPEDDRKAPADPHAGHKE